MITHNGRHITTVFHPDKRCWLAPKIADTFFQDGVRFYRDPIGGVHHANTYDKAFGRRDASAILPPSKRSFQRTRKM